MNLDLSNWREIYTKYTYAESGSIRNRIEEKGYVATPEDFDIINQITLWKINGQVHLGSETIEYLNSVAKSVKSPEDALNNTDVKELLNELLEAKGIRLPLASTILKFYQPKAFPIIKQRAYRQVFAQELSDRAGSDIYL